MAQGNRITVILEESDLLEIQRIAIDDSSAKTQNRCLLFKGLDKFVLV